MKRLTAGFLSTVVALLVASVPALAVDEGVPVTPAPLGPGNYGPDVYLAYRMLDIGIEIDGSGSTVNPTDIRPGFYAFTGEKIMYWVLVRDDNGADDIQMVKWVKEGEDQEGPCVDVTEDFPEELVPMLTDLAFDCQTDKVYYCELTVESNWDEEDPEIYVVAEDTYGDSGQTLSESWVFNPPLEISVDTNDGEDLMFGEVIKDQDVFAVNAPNCDRFIEDLTDRNCELYEIEHWLSLIHI